MPNNRQWAIIFWTTLFIFWAVKHLGLRSVWDLISGFIHPKIFVPFLIFATWTGGLLLGGHRLGIWNDELSTDTAFWFLGAGIVLFFGIANASKQERYVRSTVVGLFGVTLLVDVALEISVLSLWLELILVPLATFIVTAEVLVKTRDYSDGVRRTVSRINIALGAAIFTVGVWRIVFNFTSHDWGHLGRQLLLAIWLTIGVMPLLYGLALFVEYERVSKAVDYHSEDRWRTRVAVKAAFVREHGFNLQRLGRLSVSSIGWASKAGGWKDSRQEIQNLHRRQDEQQAQREHAELMLVEMAGVKGTDGDGRQLDRREFAETCKALRWLHTCHSGWWRRESRYTDGLLGKIASPSDSHHLHPDTGFTEVVASDGSWWFAWRRTPNDWVFAIAGIGPPHYPWTYDGPEPPTGPPGEDQVWGDDAFATDCAPNWK